MSDGGPAYCWEAGKNEDMPSRPNCILLSGHPGECQTEIRPPVARQPKEDDDGDLG